MLASSHQNAGTFNILNFLLSSSAGNLALTMKGCLGNFEFVVGLGPTSVMGTTPVLFCFVLFFLIACTRVFSLVSVHSLRRLTVEQKLWFLSGKSPYQLSQSNLDAIDLVVMYASSLPHLPRCLWCLPIAVGSDSRGPGVSGSSFVWMA